MYSTAIADPNNPNTFWISNEYVANGWWQTSVAQIGVKSSGSTTVASIVTSGPGIIGGSGDLNAGKVVTLTVNFSSAVTVDTTAGLPTLALNDGGSATYSGGSGTSALTFNYTVASGQNTSDLIVSALNLNGATIRGGVGNAADLSGATNYNPAGILQIDTTAPPVPTGLALDATTDSGAVGDGITNFSQAKIDGTAEPGNTVTLYDTDGITVLGTGTANATTGAFSITTSALADGTHSISAKASDPAGNTSVASAADQLTIDTDPPPAPTGLSLDPSTDSGTQGDGITNFTQVKIDGNAEPGNTVTLYDTDGTTVLGTGLANATTGAFSITTSMLASGTHNVTAKAVDAAGDASALSAAYALTITTNAPPAPTGLSLDATTDSGVVGDGITSFAQVKIDGTAQAGSSVTLYDTNGTTVLGTGTANATTGAFSITTSVLADGAHSISARATDGIGNTSVASTAYQVTIDTDAPPVPTGLALDATTDSGAVGDGITNFSQAKIDGTAEPGNTVTLYDTDGITVLGTGTANATTGAFSITTSALADGTHSISAKASDPAGNTSVASAADQLTIDTDPPPAPTGLSLDPSTDSGTQGDGITNFTQVKIDGNAEPGNTVTLYDTNGTTVLGTGLANATTGAFSITTSTLASGTHNVTAKAVDAAGDASALSAAYALTITTTPSSSEIDTLFSGPSSSTYPPNNGLAVGSNYVVMMEASRIEWTNLAGASPTLQSVYNFYAPLGAAADTSLHHPRCVYDSVNQRYIAIMDNSASGRTISTIDIAVSKDSNPNDGWYFAALNTSLTINGQLTSADSPTLSVDGTNIYITATQYNVNVSGSPGTECWVIGDTAGAGGGIYNGGTPTVTASELLPSSQGTFAVVAGSNGKAYYASDYRSGSQIVLTLQTYDAATNTFGPISTIGLGNIDQGGSYTAQQLGTSLLLDAGDRRARSLVYANGFLYGVAEEKPIGSSVPLVHWFKIDVSNPNSPTLVAQGDISGTSLGSNVATFNGSIAVDGAGDVIINFTASGPNMYPGDYYAYQKSGDPPGSFSAPILYQASTGFFNSGDGASVQPWGNYSTAIADPANSHSFWVSNEYVANSWWQTSVAQIEVKPLAEAPTLTISNTALTVAAGGSVPLGVQVTPVDADDAVSVTIGGLTSYETITDNLDQSIFSGSSVTLSAAEVNSGLTLHSSYTGSDHPVNNLTLAASNTTSGEAATSAVQTIVVTDPPVITSSPQQSILSNNPALAVPDFRSLDHAPAGGPAPSPYATLAGLLDQYMAARSCGGAAGVCQTSWPAPQQAWPGDQEFLTRPQC
ncbi:phosphoesterase [Bradyrhizobium sp. KBS0727]|nr:phosphoesterase [Bradyrhizobium sp. KBS0725]QDW48767.1 phosphoesterase [Bradyrhizobium sp. KBS0727]